MVNLVNADHQHGCNAVKSIISNAHTCTYYAGVLKRRVDKLLMIKANKFVHWISICSISFGKWSIRSVVRASTRALGLSIYWTISKCMLVVLYLPHRWQYAYLDIFSCKWGKSYSSRSYGLIKKKINTRKIWTQIWWVCVWASILKAKLGICCNCACMDAVMVIMYSLCTSARVHKPVCVSASHHRYTHT